MIDLVSNANTLEEKSTSDTLISKVLLLTFVVYLRLLSFLIYFCFSDDFLQRKGINFFIFSCELVNYGDSGDG